MPIYQIDYQFQYPFPENPDGWYYWTQSWYTVADDDSTAYLQLNGYVGNLLAISSTTGVQILYYQIKTPPGRQPALYVDNRGASHGLLPETEPGLLTSCVRIYGLIGGKIRWWKMHRVPLRKSDMSGDMLESSFHAYLQTNWGEMGAFNYVTTASGEPIEEYIVSPRIHMWQQRHGTKRRQRVVFAVP